MSPNVAAVISRVLGHEGGIKDVGDGKGVTSFGQTPTWLKSNGFKAPKSGAEAALNYARWMERLRIAEICDWDPTVGHLVTDLSIHAGEDVAIKALQRIVGAVADGKIGPQTLALVKGMATERLARRMIGETIRHGGRVLRDKPERRQFAAGWADRWADHVEALP